MNKQKLLYADSSFEKLRDFENALAAVDAIVVHGNCKTPEDVIASGSEAVCIVTELIPFKETVFQACPALKLVYTNNVGKGRSHFDEIETLVINDTVSRTNALKSDQIDAMNRCDLKTAHLLKRAGMEQQVFTLYASNAAFAGGMDAAVLFKEYANKAGVKMEASMSFM
jgi:hypothetical protein